ncbi:MAG: hypothetical protein ABMA14_16360 [Hyphomonadaceae bacterium]
MTDIVFLTGIPVDHVLARLADADGDEINSGKLQNPDSSAMLAVNAFGWFIERPALLPPFPELEGVFPASMVEVEFKARFPWRGGRHPSLDAAVETATHFIGIESKRYEPFRDTKSVNFSDAYDRPVWGENMGPFEKMRDQLRSRDIKFDYLDAAQLVKHAFGLVTEGVRRKKTPALVYLYSEPARLAGKDIHPEAIDRHRQEVREFGLAVAGAEVGFSAVSYREWIGTWGSADETVVAHGRRLLDVFAP